MVIATFIFVCSIVGIAGLFALKFWEEARGRVLLPLWRTKADAAAMAIYGGAAQIADGVERVPAFSVLFVRWLIHMTAVVVAHTARIAEQRAYDVADFVSHKHTFERGETRSAFLRSVAVRKRRIPVQQADTSLQEKEA
jgi:hypothetical protein